MPESIGFTSLTVEGFRAFARPQAFDLAASAVVITGSNGTGKTSFFDAIQWLLLGSIPRLAALRTKRTDEYILNEYTATRPARVEAQLLLGGNVVTLIRTGKHDRNEITWSATDGKRARGAEADELIRRSFISTESITLEVGLLTFGLLQQDVVRAVLHSRPSERYDLLSRMLGLDRLEQFDSEARQNLERARKRRADADRDLEQAKSRHDTDAAAVREVRLRANAGSPIEASRSALRTAADQAGLMIGDLPTAADAARAASQARGLADDVSALRQERERLEAAKHELLTFNSDEIRNHLQRLGERVRALEAELASARESLDGVLRSARSFEQLAALAIPLLTDACPVCGQRINPKNLASELRHRAPLSERVAQETGRRDRAEASLTSAQAELDAARQAMVSLQRLEGQRVQSSLVTAGILERINGSALRHRADIASLNASALVQFRERCITVAETATVLASAMAVAAQSQDIPRREAQLKSAEQALAVAQEGREQAIRREAKAKTLAQAARDARVAVMQGRFERLRPLIRDVYQRLDPHPTFRDFSVKVDTYWQRGTSMPMVTDAEMKIDANPLLVFSSAQANITALAYFLAMGWASQRSAWPFVLLDDPLQSMDDVNALGFADLCRFIRAERQLVLSTHETRLAGLLERKLAPRVRQERTLIVHFEGWERPGPVVQQRQVEPQYLEGKPLVLATA